MLMIDPHVHLRDWSQSAKETLVHGMSVGVQAGIGTFFDMPNTDPPLTDMKTVERRLADGRAAARIVAESSGVEPAYHVYGGLTADPKQVRDMASIVRNLFPATVGLKMFAGHSTGNMGLVTEEVQRQVYRTLAESGYRGVLAVHCEKESLLKTDVWSVAEPVSHSVARPPYAEIESVRDQLRFATEEGFAGTLHICHISTGGALDLVSKARTDGGPFRVTCGATAHHALLSTTAYAVSGNLVKMNPPLREEEDRFRIFSALLDGTVDWVESDHAPHTIADKQRGASGIPGFGGTLRLIAALRKAGCSDGRLFDLFGRNVARTFGLPWEGKLSFAGLAQTGSSRRRVDDAYPWNPFLAFDARMVSKQ